MPIETASENKRRRRPDAELTRRVASGNRTPETYSSAHAAKREAGSYFTQIYKP